MSNIEMREPALRRYLVFRIKFLEYLDLSALLQGLEKHDFCPQAIRCRRPDDYATSLRTVLLSWFALFVDRKGGMDVIELWKELFPKHRTLIEETWSRIQPAWEILRVFRNRAGFHADKPLRFFKAKSEIWRHQRTLIEAMDTFNHLALLILTTELNEIPELEDAVDCLLDELETIPSEPRWKRAEFKRYLLIPNTSSTTSTSNQPSG